MQCEWLAPEPCGPDEVDPITLAPPRYPLRMRCVSAQGGGVATFCFDVPSLMVLYALNATNRHVTAPLLNPLNRVPFTAPQLSELRSRFAAVPAVDRAPALLDLMRLASQADSDARVFLRSEAGFAVEWRHDPESDTFSRHLYERAAGPRGGWTTTGLSVPVGWDAAAALAGDLDDPAFQSADLVVVRSAGYTLARPQRYGNFFSPPPEPPA